MRKRVPAGPSDLGTRAQILNVAASMFRKQGYAAVSLRSIAHEAGLTTGSLYYYFSSKEEIVSEVLRAGPMYVLNKVRSSVERLGPTATPVEILKAAILAHIESVIGENSFPAANIRIHAHVPREIRKSTSAVRMDYENYWIKLLASCGLQEMSNDDFDPTLLAFFLFGAMNWTLEWYRPGRYNVDTIAETLARLVVERQPLDKAIVPSMFNPSGT